MPDREFARPGTANPGGTASPAGQALRVLVVEDSEADFELLARELHRQDLHAVLERVHTAAGLDAALAARRWDLVISDFTLATINGFEALDRVRAFDANLPFILVSGTVGEDVAVESLHRGASDYVMKGNLARLAPAVERALRDASRGRERSQLLEALRRSEANFRHLVTQAADGFCLCDCDGRFLMVNARYCEILGYTERELLGLHPSRLRRGGDAEAGARLARLRERGRVQFECDLLRKDGRLVPAEVSMRVQDDGLMQGVVRDITARRRAEAQVRRLNRVYAALSGINGLIVRARDRDTLFRDACRAAAEAGGFCAAWAGTLEGSEWRPAAQAGPAAGEPASAPVLRDLAERATRAKHAVTADNFPPVPTLGMVRAVAAFPLPVAGETAALFMLASEEEGFFGAEEMTLLTELARDMGFALDHIDSLDKLDYLAYYDEVSGLPNRHQFQAQLAAAVERAARADGRMAVAVIDIDGFKGINDTLGQEAGDELLRQAGRRLANGELAGGLAEAPRPARLGADQFAVIAPAVASEAGFAASVAALQQACFGPPFLLGGSELRVSAKVGVALFPDNGADARTLFKNAEAALKKAKDMLEPYLFFTSQMTEQVASRLAMINSLRRALERGEFVLHYQPKVHTGTWRVAGMEALIRWNDQATGRLVPPMQFVPLLEETGLIIEVGAWALGQAMRDRARWEAACGVAGAPRTGVEGAATTPRVGIEGAATTPRVAVNVSAVQLRRREFVNSVQAALGQAAPAGDAHGIDLEITESLIMEDFAGNADKLRMLRDLGMHIAIDDFGTGYSSLAYLARLPVASLKIDRSFVATMLDDPNVMTLVKTVISLAHSFGLQVVAEGVESAAQRHVLQGLGCDQMQGFFFSQPLPAEAVPALLSRGALA